MRFQPGRQIGDYTIVEHVARGSSGHVFRAHRSPGIEPVALKVYDSGTDTEPQEVALLRSVTHPNLVRYITSGTLEGQPWLATKWAEGRTLAHLITTEGPLSVARTNRLVSQLASAVDALHDHGIVHGDLSPRNMVVDLHDELIVIDLGEAISATHASIDETTDLKIATTPRYAAPEVAAGGLPIPASDRYAVAMIAYESLTGRSPFPSVETPIAMLAHHLSTPPTPPTEVLPSLPAHIEDALLRGLAKNPAHRHSRAVAFASELDTPPTNDLLGGPSKPGKRNRSTSVSTLAGILVAVAALIAAIGYFALNRQAETGSAANDDAALPTTELPNSDWPPGTAAGLTCNLLEVPGFEQGRFPENYYRADDREATPRLVPGAGIGGSSAARIGTTGQFSLYAETIPVTGDTDYVLSAWVRMQGEPIETGIYINYLDAAFAPLTDGTALLPAAVRQASTAGTRFSIVAASPADAAWAVPTFFKDGSGGSMLIDEVVFGRASQCGVVVDS